VSARGPLRVWSAADDAELRRRFADERTATIAADLGRTYAATAMRAASLRLKKSDAYMRGPDGHRWTGHHPNSVGRRFAPGHVPANKGQRRPGWTRGRMAETQFKKGERRGASNTNWRPVGTVMADSDGYLRVKLREPLPGERSGFGNAEVWKQLHRRLWEEAHGPVPEGHALRFIDGNRQNCVLDNIECVPRAEMMRRNSVHNLPPALKSTIQLLGTVKRQINRRTASHGHHAA